LLLTLLVLRSFVSPDSNGDVGMHATFEMTGTPPFTIHYERKKKEDGKLVRGTRQFNGVRGEIDLTPETAGEYTYVSFAGPVIG
jgi:nucleoporin POM152